MATAELPVSFLCVSISVIIKAVRSVEELPKTFVKRCNYRGIYESEWSLHNIRLIYPSGIRDYPRTKVAFIYPLCIASIGDVFDYYEY